MKSKAEKKEARKARLLGVPAVDEWRWSHLRQAWLDHKRQQGRARLSTLAGYEYDLTTHVDPFLIVKLDDPPLGEITAVVISSFRQTITGAKGTRRRAKWNKLVTLGREVFEFARSVTRTSARKPMTVSEHCW